MSGRYGCFVGGQLLGEGCATREEADQQAVDARGDHPDMDVAVDVITSKRLYCPECDQVTVHDLLGAGEWECDCGWVTTIREED